MPFRKKKRYNKTYKHLSNSNFTSTSQYNPPLFPNYRNQQGNDLDINSLQVNQQEQIPTFTLNRSLQYNHSSFANIQNPQTMFPNLPINEFEQGPVRLSPYLPTPQFEGFGQVPRFPNPMPYFSIYEPYFPNEMPGHPISMPHFREQMPCPTISDSRLLLNEGSFTGSDNYHINMLLQEFSPKYDYYTNPLHQYDQSQTPYPQSYIVDPNKVRVVSTTNLASNIHTFIQSIFLLIQVDFSKS